MKTPTTIVVAIAAIATFASPSLATLCQVDFDLIGDGQWWRILTGHFTHFDGSHLFWDLLMFGVLGAVCECRHRRFFPFAMAFMAAGITASIAVWCDGIDVYRGLSGIDTGLFVWFVIDQCRASWMANDKKSAALWLVPAIGLVGKSIFEAQTGQTVFVDSSTFTPLVQSHLAGAAIGVVCASAHYRIPIQRLSAFQNGWFSTKHSRATSSARGV
ncbi:rhombosortase [Rubripirellula reticaptiva]|uniref:Rhomboid family protein n=1 Tax=Rubripirellula reticaptiva TaxID=2528013 RepID=A0A5C6FB99_9BACT|nr:rhombosortase [Rubripirellula reticaptiva]TWU57807.1 Rhomboid family protein [Rubripirellula reticaptiva]